MSKYKIKEITDKQKWENFVLSQDTKSFLQSWNWGETNRIMGNKIFRIGFYGKDRLNGVCLVIKEEAKRGNHLLIPGGPLIDWKDKKLVQSFKEEIKYLAEKENVWFVRVRPELLETKDNRKRLEKLGFLPAPMHLHAENTWVLDIERPEEEILMNMRKNTRYGVRRSLENNFDTKMSRDPGDAEKIYRLQKLTVERHGFVGFPKILFEAQLKTFGKDEQAFLFLIKQDKRLDVAAIIIFYGSTAYYHQSASSEESRENYASYFLQWKVIKEAKKRKLKRYDMWGAVPEGEENHRFSGPSLFKKGFGPERIVWLHAHDLPTHPFYWGSYLFETGRRIVRGL